ncbi:TetR/AcrR family transcriptional regulator [Demequina phytophila]|uniref:TetR/AcrR family transcriptional regulator n=1 Tax=Demequina phytophila TaxID=1638981 RepID=UPI00078425AC|nr:TetR/AcrR family transcriptional regulator [Demequina phytophila]
MTEHRRPGRPQIADPDQIARIAATLFAERGYAAVSMDDIAERSGVSRRTLFRHFTNKADLVWRDFFATYRRLAEVLEEPSTAPGMPGLRAAMRQTLGVPSEEEEISRVRLTIIGASAEVFAAGVRGLADMTEELTRHLAKGGAYAEDSLEARTAGQAVTGAILASAVWWAGHSEDPIEDAIDAALEQLEAGLR